ncbi:MAG: sugar ABC transporter permease [Eubacteriales bacterium]|nr:sugar ABC transporter permease [Eubacteriales bacterium]
MLYRDRRPLLVFLLLPLLLMAVFLYYPFVVNIYNSLFDIKGLIGKPGEFLGLGNFSTFFTRDPVAMRALRNSALMMPLSLVFQVGLGLVLALMVDSVRRGQQFFRIVFFFPIVISATAIGLMFSLFYSYEGGMLNQLMVLMGRDKVLWLSKERAYTMLVIPVLWQYVGFYFVILLAGVNAIPDEIFESAAMDGAAGLRRIWYITLPLLRDVLITCATLAVTGAIKVFDLPSVIARNGAPNGLTHFLGTYMHNQAFVAQNVDYGSAISIIIVLLGVLAAGLMTALMRRGGEAL